MEKLDKRVASRQCSWYHVGKCALPTQRRAQESFLAEMPSEPSLKG